MSRTTIPRHEIEPHPLSQWDAMGRLFGWRGQLYRGLTPRMAPFYRRLFDEGVIAELVQRGLLVDSEATDLQTPDHDLVVHHRQLPFISYPFEWSRDMLRAASALCCELQQVLAGRGCALSDFSPINILFDGTRPVFVDLCSIVPAHVAPLARWDGWDVFEASFLAPLALMDRGLDRAARSLLAECGGAVEGREAWRRALQAAACVLPVPQAWLSLQPRFVSALQLAGYPEDGRAAYMRWIRRRLRELDRVAVPPHRQDLARPAPPRAFDDVITAAVERLAPRTVLLTGCSGLALSLPRPGRAVVALDPDARRVASCHREAQRLAVNLLALVVDVEVANATPPHVALRSAFELSPRLRAELVIDLPWQQQAQAPAPRAGDAARLVGSLTGRWLLTEARSWGVPADSSPEATARRLEAVLDLPLRRCQVLSRQPGSSLLLCERRDPQR